MIDSLKGISCIAILLIHYNFPGQLGIAIKTVCRFATAYFFFVSGFFAVREGEIIRHQSFCKKAKHILRLLLLSAIFYAVFCLIWNNIAIPNWDWSAFVRERITVPRVMKLIITNDPFVYAHLWFMMALIYCYLTFLLFDRKKVNGRLCLIISILLMGIFSTIAQFNKYLGIPSSINLWGTQERLYLFNLHWLRAFPFFLLGIGFRSEESKIRYYIERIPQPIWWAGLVAGGIIAIVERVGFRESQFYLGTYISLFSVCAMSISSTRNGIPILEGIGRDVSVYVYILHIAVGKSLDIVAEKYHLFSKLWFQYSRALIILVLTLAIAYLLDFVKERFGKFIQTRHKQNESINPPNV